MTRFSRLVGIGILLFFLGAACSPQTTPLPDDAMSTSIALGVIVAQSQTAQTQTSTPLPTVTSSPTQQPVVMRLSACWFGPGRAYRL